MRLSETRFVSIPTLLKLTLLVSTMSRPIVSMASLRTTPEGFKKYSPEISLPPEPHASKLELMQRVLVAIEKTFTFFLADYSDLNVDGLFGIRLAEGSIHGAIKECDSGKLACPEDLRNKLDDLMSTINYVAKKAEPYIEAQDPSYFHRFYDVISNEYSLDYRAELLVKGRHVPKSNKRYNEEKGDRCLNKLTGTGTDIDGPVPRCTITDECWRFMTKPDLDDYSITHQLLYFIFIDKTDCLKEAMAYDKHGDPNVLRKQERNLCKNILGELRGEYDHEFNNVDIRKQDLFLEQSVLCGMLGFEDFFEDEYIEMVLGWQYPIGCFSMEPRLLERFGLEEAHKHHHTAVAKLLKSLRKEAEDIKQAPAPTGTRRKLMRETAMEGHCLAHKTGLGIGTLGAYLRYLMDVLYSVKPHKAVRLA